MKIVITGISGFVGPYLKRELVSHGHEVLGIDRKSSGAHITGVDLLDGEQVKAYFNNNSCDWVVHLAAITSVKQSWEDPEKFLSINVGMTRNVYQAVLEFSPMTKILLVSTSDVYGAQTKFPIAEGQNPHPQNPYAKSKLAQENVATEFAKISTIITRAFNHPGPGAPEFLAIPNFAKQIALIEKGQQVEMRVGNLDSFRDFVDVRDVVRAYRLLIEKGKLGEKYNICSGHKRKMQDILDDLIKLSTTAINIKEDPDLMRPSDVPEFYGSFEKVKEAVGWSPTIPFRQTLEDTLIYWRTKI